MPVGAIGQHFFDQKVFVENLVLHMTRAGMNAARLSKLAGLNPRAVRDILDGRVESPRVKTVLALEKALKLEVGALLGFGPGAISFELYELLSELDAKDQRKLLDILLLFRREESCGHVKKATEKVAPHLLMCPECLEQMYFSFSRLLRP